MPSSDRIADSANNPFWDFQALNSSLPPQGFPSPSAQAPAAQAGAGQPGGSSRPGSLTSQASPAQQPAMSDPTLFTHPGFLSNPQIAMQTITSVPALRDNAAMAHSYLTLLQGNPQAAAAMVAGLGGHSPAASRVSDAASLAPSSFAGGDSVLRERRLDVREQANQVLTTAPMRRLFNELPNLESQERFLRAVPFLQPENPGRIGAPASKLPDEFEAAPAGNFDPDEKIRLKTSSVSARDLARQQGGTVILVANGAADQNQQFALQKTTELATKELMANPGQPLTVKMMNEHDHEQMPLINVSAENVNNLEKLFGAEPNGMTDTSVGLLDAARFLDRRNNQFVGTGHKKIHLVGNLDVNASEFSGKNAKAQKDAADSELKGVIVGLHSKDNITVKVHLTSSKPDVQARGDLFDSQLKGHLDVDSSSRDVELQQLNERTRKDQKLPKNAKLSAAIERQNTARLDMKQLFGSWHSELGLADNKTGLAERAATFRSKATYTSSTSLAQASARLDETLRTIPVKRMQSLAAAISETSTEEESTPPVKLH